MCAEMATVPRCTEAAGWDFTHDAWGSLSKTHRSCNPSYHTGCQPPVRRTTSSLGAGTSRTRQDTSFRPRCRPGMRRPQLPHLVPLPPQTPLSCPTGTPAHPSCSTSLPTGTPTACRREPAGYTTHGRLVEKHSTRNGYPFLDSWSPRSCRLQRRPTTPFTSSRTWPRSCAWRRSRGARRGPPS